VEQETKIGLSSGGFLGGLPSKIHWVCVRVSQPFNVPHRLLLAMCWWLLCQANGAFPYDVSVMELDKELDWNPNVSQINQWPLAISDDGFALIYKSVLTIL